MSVHLKNHDFPSTLLYQRRMSICGESYDPTKEEEIKVVCVPKTAEQRLRIEGCIKDLFIFQNLDKEQYEGLIEALQERKLQPGECVIKQGEEGKVFYIIEDGVFHGYITKDESEILTNTFEKKGYFGELCLMYGQPLPMSVRAVTAGTLWYLDRYTYTRIVIGLRSRKLLLLETYLKTIPFLKNLKPRECSEVATVMKQVCFCKGDRIAKQGDPEDGLYFLLKGALLFRQKLNNGTCSQWREVVCGTFIGEKSLLEPSCWISTICAETSVELAYISKEAFEKIIGPIRAITDRNK